MARHAATRGGQISLPRTRAMAHQQGRRRRWLFCLNSCAIAMASQIPFVLEMVRRWRRFMDGNLTVQCKGLMRLCILCMVDGNDAACPHGFKDEIQVRLNPGSKV
jgi:hypothetical protein